MAHTQTATAHAPLAGGSINLIERGLVPDPLIRAGIRRMCGQRLAEIARCGRRARQPGHRSSSRGRCAPPRSRRCRNWPTHSTTRCRRTSSSTCWGRTASTAAPGGPKALRTWPMRNPARWPQTAERAQLADGQRVLELGCGWGSLTLWMARHFPASRIVGVSNSRSQRESILAARPGRGPAQRRDHHRRHESLPHATAASIAWCRWRCSSTCATGRRCSPACTTG